jgi:heterodisulfide reductase subunit D
MINIGYFYILFILSFFIFIIGIIYRLYPWGKGEIKKGAKYRLKEKILTLLREYLNLLKDKKSLYSIFKDSFLQIRLFKECRTRWLMHLSIFLSFIILFFIGSLGNMLTKWGIWEVDKDAPLFAIINDFAGLIALTGIIYYIYRRYIHKPPQLRNVWDDAVILILIFTSLISGFLLESLRFLSNGNISIYSPVGYIISNLIDGFNIDYNTLYPYSWWFHATISLSIISYLPYSKLFHIFVSPLSISFTYMDDLKIKNRIVEKESPSFYTFKEMVELDACTRCGECVKWCEVYRETEKDEDTPFGKIYRLRKIIEGSKRVDIKEFSKGVFNCTLCAKCQPVCPVKIETRSLMISMREYLIDNEEFFKDSVKELPEIVETKHNVLNFPNDDRALWVEYLDEFPDNLYIRDKAQTLYFVGCIASFSPSVQDIPMANIKILNKLGIDFSILGGKEWCCGFPLIIAGMGDRAVKLKEHNINMVKELGAKRILFNCPSCYYTWKNEYRVDGIELMHFSEFINLLIKNKKIELSGLKKRVTYHDPCDLGRGLNIFEEPRMVIKSIPGIDFFELSNNRKKGYCCGGGGDMEMIDHGLSVRISSHLIDETEDMGGEILLTACQQCKRMILNGIKEKRSKIKVMDISELIERVI